MLCRGFPIGGLVESNNVKKRLGSLRGNRSYAEFASDTNVSASLLQRYETGGGLPSTENLILMALSERINLNWLLLGYGKRYR